jgi:hypothetical protein
MTTRVLLGVACFLFGCGGLRAADDPVSVARAEVEARKERVEWAERMVKLQYMAEGQFGTERRSLAAAELALLKAEVAAKAAADRVRIAKADVALANANLQAARARAAWADQMAKKGYLGAAEVKAEEARVAQASVALQKAIAELNAVAPAGPEKKK